MAADYDGDVLRVPGRLAYGTNISLSGEGAAFPYGGTSLGLLANGVQIDHVPAVLIPLSASDRRRPFNYLAVHAGELRVTVEPLQWDVDALAMAFPTGFSSTGGATGKRLMEVPGTFDDGTFADTLATQLLFAPENTRDAPWFFAPAAVPWPEEAARLRFERGAELTNLLVFRLLKGTYGNGTNAPCHYLLGDMRDLAVLL